MRLETQVNRLVSDAESEKDTRKRSNQDITTRFEKTDERIRSLERTIWSAAGAVSLLVFIINFWMKNL